MKKARVGLAVTLILYLALGVYYALVTPIFEAPHEIGHFFYAKHLIDTLSLPVQAPHRPNLWGAEGSHPPLYDVALALVLAPLPTDRAGDYLWRNPYVNLTHPMQPGNKNYLIHTEKERWPYRDVPLAVHVARGISLLFGLATLVVIYTISRQLLRERYLALAATATVAFLPQFLFLSATLNSHIALALTSSIALALTAHIILKESRCTHVILLALTAAVAALTRIEGIAVAFIGLLATGVFAWRRRRWLYRLGMVALYCSVVMLLAGWWYVRNVYLYGDPLGLSGMAGYRLFDHPPLGWQDLPTMWMWFRRSFWALFGWYNVPIGPRAYRLLDGVLIVIVVGLGVAVVRHRIGRRRPLVILFVGTFFMLVLLASTFYALGLTPYPLGVHLYPLVFPLAWGFVRGWESVVPTRWQRYWVFGLPVGLLALAVVTPGRWIRPAYTPPPRVSPQEIPSHARSVDMVFGDRIRVWAVDIPQITTHPGDTIDVTLYMSKVGELPVDYTLRFRLLGRQNEPVGHMETFTGWGTYPTRLWKDGDVIVDHYRVKVSPHARVPTLLRIHMEFFNHWTGEHLVPKTHQGVPITGKIGTLRLVALHPSPPTPQVPMHAIFGDEIALVGVDPPQVRAHGGETITFRLYWQALRPASASYTVFTHLIRPHNPHPIAQHDKLPLDGDYPTVAWAPGETVVDTYTIPIPENTPRGTYQVVTGLYQLQTLQRLPLTEGKRNPWVDNGVTIFTLEIEPNKGP